ncbi:hypothetical protein DSO57_1008738 [Entomophthora muscae]|uniref:Uncharacterized protein n=1 Tax=Entomophthora muscae TaxID=34485 RepID=A0ACC2TIB2_9FUNG|nr:hypothetical protein DSO57_1008738 [Entomophthora muscae]
MQLIFICGLLFGLGGAKTPLHGYSLSKTCDSVQSMGGLSFVLVTPDVESSCSGDECLLDSQAYNGCDKVSVYANFKASLDFNADKPKFLPLVNSGNTLKRKYDGINFELYYRPGTKEMFSAPYMDALMKSDLDFTITLEYAHYMNIYYSIYPEHAYNQPKFIFLRPGVFTFPEECHKFKANLYVRLAHQNETFAQMHPECRFLLDDTVPIHGHFSHDTKVCA